MDKAICGTFVVVLLVIAYGAFCATQSAIQDNMAMTVEHAVRRHPDTAPPVMTAVASGEVLAELYNPSTGRTAKVCKPDALDKHGVEICAPENDKYEDNIVTAFEHEKGETIWDTINYLMRGGYELVALASSIKEAVVPIFGCLAPIILIGLCIYGAIQS